MTTSERVHSIMDALGGPDALLEVIGGIVLYRAAPDFWEGLLAEMTVGREEKFALLTALADQAAAALKEAGMQV